MGYPMDEEQTLNYLARRIHDWAIRKKFYEPCKTCQGKQSVEGEDWYEAMSPFDRLHVEQIKKAYAFCLKNPGCSIVCPVCDGRGSQRDLSTFDRYLMHIVGEVTEGFDLTRDHSIEELIAFTGRPGVTTGDIRCVPKVPDKDLPAHPALAVELADIIIRTLDTARWLGLDVGTALMDKLAFNDTRPEKHGRRH